MPQIPQISQLSYHSSNLPGNLRTVRDSNPRPLAESSGFKPAAFPLGQPSNTY